MASGYKKMLRKWKLVFGLITALFLAGPLAAQTIAPIDTSGLGSGRYATMEMLFERTFLRVDVMRLTLRFDPPTEEALQTLIEGQNGAATADAVANIALESTDVMVRGVFLRNVSLSQFLDGLLTNLKNARKAGLVTEEEYRKVEDDVNVQYEPLRERGLHNGDTMWYRVSGDSLHVVVEASDGEILIESRAVGPERRRSVLGGYLAPGSEFRGGLIGSVLPH
jgi:hypothetical protein